MRLEIKNTLKIGIVPEISLNRDEERLSSFLRLIYEPIYKKLKIIIVDRESGSPLSSCPIVVLFLCRAPYKYQFYFSTWDAFYHLR